MNPVRHILRFSLRDYQLGVSPLLHALCGPLAGCRYTPTCSQYAAEAIQSHGTLKGGSLAVRRLCRCHPWGGSGEDPVPLVQEPPHERDLAERPFINAPLQRVGCGESGAHGVGKARGISGSTAPNPATLKVASITFASAFRRPARNLV